MSIKADLYVKVHPGEILSQILKDSGITQIQLANRIKITQSKVSDLVKGKLGVSAEMAHKLAKVFNMKPETWMNFQKNWELSLVDTKKLDSIKPFSTKELKNKIAA